jgi:glycosyltransferase involved in cell wall biosynthesis
MKIIINASNMHTGGGKTMLIDALNAAKDMKHIIFIVYIDERFDEKSFLANNITFKKCTLFKRIFLSKNIQKLSEAGDIIIYFGNVPPFIKHNTKTILFQSNRMIIENYPLARYPLKWKIRVPLEKFFVRLCINNADEIVVQTLTMKDIIKSFRINKFKGKIRILPFKNLEEQLAKSSLSESESFLYVAGPDPHKNHKNLLKAWKLLDFEGIKPKLYLTIDDDSFVSEYNFIKTYIDENQLNVSIKPRLNRKDLLGYYTKVSALIYPSVFEAYGLPLIEAQKFNLPIIASELNYVRDLIDPNESFDPHSPRSISRSVKRFLAIKEVRKPILTSEQLFKEIL